MFDDDDFIEGEGKSLEQLLQDYMAIKNGQSRISLDEDDFEEIIDYFIFNTKEMEGLEACEIALGYFPFSSTILQFKAEILAQLQRYGQALQVLDDLDRLDQKNVSAVLLRADIYLNQLKYKQAADCLENNIAHFGKKDQIELLMELSDVYDEAEEFEAVFDTLKRVVKIDSRNEEALQKICFWADFTKQLEESVELHTELCDKDPYNATAWFNLGAAYQGLRLYEKSADAYEYCIAIDDKFEFAYRNMADAFMRLKWFDKAIEVLEKHIEIAQPEDIIFEAIGHCWEKKKLFQKARYYYRQASLLNPKDASIFFKIGETYTRERQWEKAAKAFAVALHLDTNNAQYNMAIGNCLMHMNIPNEAVICYLNAVRIKPNIKTTWVALIKGLYISKLFEDALLQLEIAKEHCGAKPEFYYLQAACLFAIGKSKDALKKLELGLKSAPQKVASFIALDADLIRRNKVSELIAAYKRKK